MSAYPPPSQRRQPSSASSVASSYVSNYFPESRSSTVTSVSSLSSRFSNNGSPTKASDFNTTEQASPAGMSRVASIYGNGRESPPPLRSRGSTNAPRPTATSVRHSFHEDELTKLAGSNHFRFPPPASPSPLSTSPTKSPPGSPVKRMRDQAKEFNRRSISFADTSIPDDLSAMRHSSVSHLRTLSQVSRGAANEFNEAVGEELVGLHGRRRLQRAQTESLSSWDRLNWMDKRRQYIQAYEYLCHIGEAKEWMEECIGEPIPAIVELEEALRDGVTLAKLVRVFAPELVPRIFDAKKLQFRHSDNINRFFQFVKKVQLPEIFLFELTDLYNKKNIPKVIYCIHALSFLLFRLGMTRIIIGNLVGKLEFTEAEIQNTQKGLDQAGVVLPNFRGVNKHFDPEPPEEPEETEEERIERELGECEFSVKRLQRAARGALVRLRLGDTVEELWSYEEEVIQLQAAIRGMFARVRYSYYAERDTWARELQAVARGYLIRKALELKLRNFTANERLIVRLQARYRSKKARAETRAQIQRLEKGARNIVGLQAAIRGALVRRSLQVQTEHAYENEDRVTSLQALARGALLRKSIKKDTVALESKPTENAITRLQAKARGMLLRKSLLEDAKALTTDRASDAIEDLQAAARGLLVRQAMKQQKQDLKAVDDVKLHQLQAAIRGSLLRAAVKADQSSLVNAEGTWTKLQAAAKAMLLRQVVREKQDYLQGLLPSIIKMQSVARGWLARDEYEDMLEVLEDAEEEIVDLQALSKGYLARRDFQATQSALKSQTSSVILMQGVCRGVLTRKRNNAFMARLQATSDSVARLQAHFRGAVIRGQVADTNAYLDDEEEAVLELQARARGMVQRKRYQDKLKFYNDNMQKVIKIQSFVRAKQQGEAYRSLTEGKNPPVGTIKNFVHLLNDSDFDFDEEIEFERLRKNVVQHVAANELAENYIDQLDIKIALLVKNKITLDEVIKHQKRFTGHVGGLLSNVDLASADPFDLKALNKNSRRKLELYQMLFFALQTQPVYLARLFTNVREQGTPEKEMKRTENLIMGLFGYAQKRREEYYLLKLITKSIREEVDRCGTLQDYLRGNFFWVKLLQSYIRNPKDRKFLKDMLGPILKERILDDRHLNLESDPLRIYHSSIGDEELRTGKKSSRRHSIGREEAIRDPETRATFIERLQYLRDLCSAVLDSLDNQLSRMPYGIRYIAKQSYECLCEKFPNESPDAVLQAVVHFVYQKYLKPAIIGPDAAGIVAKALDEKQKKNLGELSKLINQLSLGKLFSHDNIYLLPLNEYVDVNKRRMHEIFVDVIAIKDAETHFDIDEFDDLTSRQKPTLYMKMAEIFSIHRLVAQKIDVMSPAREDQLRDIIRELGSVKANESELRTMANAEITLYLNPRFQKVEDPDSEMKALMVETKRCILYIIRIQTGADLMEILVKPVRQEDEDRWRQLLEEEHSGKRRGAYADSTTLSDVSSMTYTDLKRTALENIVRLEHAGKITRKNHYQDLLNFIAVDIRTKHRRRVQRQKELENVRGTLSHLNEKATYLEGQLQSYNDYIEQAMQTLQSKKGKRRTILPFTRQYFHIRELQRSGKVPKFGSYNYSARALADKGVLVALEGYPERQWGSISITIQSDEVGIFRLEMSYGSMIIPGGSMDIPLDDLLQAQFNNNQFMMLFEGMAKVNVNLFLHLLFRKFYRDE